MPAASGRLASAFRRARRSKKEDSGKALGVDAENPEQPASQPDTGDHEAHTDSNSAPSLKTDAKTESSPIRSNRMAQDDTPASNVSNSPSTPSKSGVNLLSNTAKEELSSNNLPNAASADLHRRNLLVPPNEDGMESQTGSSRSSLDVMSARSSIGSPRPGTSPEPPTHPNELNTIAQLDKLPVGTDINFYARIHSQRQLSKALDFLLLRDQTHSIQGVLSHDNMDMIEWVQKLSQESLVHICGTLKEPPEPIRTGSHAGVEVQIHTVHLVNEASNVPFNNNDPPETLRNRMNSRILDLRHPSNQVLFRLRSLVTRKFRETLEAKGFIEINTPKLQPAATESGASVFKVNYFGRNAFLAQSPQLAKQMCISADFRRVFEVGPVFRAENSNTHRHLTEYTGLDLEMAIENDYHEVMWVIDDFLRAAFEAIYSSEELELLRRRWPSRDFKWLNETLVLDFREGIRMLREDGRNVEEEDLSTPDEIRLGQLVREKYNTDYYILDKFPASARPFYTHKDPENPDWTRSFDIFIRGQEICTGGQRIHQSEELRANMLAADVPEDGMEDYLKAFELGPPPHAGAGLGLERIVAWMLELGDVRYASLFHRDPKSLPERRPGLPHPDADTTIPRAKDNMPAVEKLIANYGDAANTSWLDDEFEIWRHSSGAAVGYVRRKKFAMVIGDPLCDAGQHKLVCHAFVNYVKSELRLTPVWMLVSYDVQEILAHDMAWRTMSCTEEQRVDVDQRKSILEHKARRVEREGVKIQGVKADADFIKRANPAIEEWKSSRKGRQFHLTKVRPWVDMEHRRYFSAEKEGKVLALVILHKLAPRYGWQIKWSFDLPGSINGAIEVLINYARSSVAGRVTFGTGVSDKLTPGEQLNGIQARLLASAYQSIVESRGLRRKADFRNKFGVVGESVYICYPKHGVGLLDIQQVIKFFQG